MIGQRLTHQKDRVEESSLFQASLHLFYCLQRHKWIKVAINTHYQKVIHFLTWTIRITHFSTNQHSIQPWPFLQHTQLLIRHACHLLDRYTWLRQQACRSLCKPQWPIPSPQHAQNTEKNLALWIPLPFSHRIHSDAAASDALLWIKCTRSVMISITNTSLALKQLFSLILKTWDKKCKSNLTVYFMPSFKRHFLSISAIYVCPIFEHDFIHSLSLTHLFVSELHFTIKCHECPIEQRLLYLVYPIDHFSVNLAIIISASIQVKLIGPNLCFKTSEAYCVGTPRTRGHWSQLSQSFSPSQQNPIVGLTGPEIICSRD